MVNDTALSSHKPFPGRGVAMRFHGLADLGPPPQQAPTPPAPVTQVPSPSREEGDPPFLTIAQASSLIRARQLSPVELTRALLARIDRLNPLLNAYITVTADLALAQAREAEEEIQRGHYRGPLHGIPLSIKDLIATAGVLTTGGPAALSDWVPREDAAVWHRLREAGAVLLGKLGLHEMAAGFTNLNPFYGVTRNPWDSSRITGGSSGGSGAAVASHLCLASIGSDTAGSIRVPSALCGITGLKPTFGRVSTRGALYLSWSMDHLAPMAKTAEDAALLLNVIGGHDPLNPLSAPASEEDYTANLKEGLRGLRLGVPSSYFWEFDAAAQEDGGETRPGLDQEEAAAVRNAIALLDSLGANTSEVAIDDLEGLVEGASNLNVERAFFVEELPPERRELFSERYRDSVIRGLETTASSYLRSLQYTQRIHTALERAMEGFDALIVPTTPMLAPSVESVEVGAARAAEAAAEAKARGDPPPPAGGPTANIGRYTSPFNRSGQPAITIPCGFSSNGLPIGIMIVGSHFAEATVLRVSHAYQQATEWHLRRPPLDV